MCLCVIPPRLLLMMLMIFYLVWSMCVCFDFGLSDTRWVGVLVGNRCVHLVWCVWMCAWACGCVCVCVRARARVCTYT